MRDSARATPWRARIGAILLIAGCLGKGGVPAVPGPPPAPHDGLTVTLAWDAPVDLDLYVTDPSWQTFYYARPGEVVGPDARCSGPAPQVRWERAHWTRPRSGRYRVGVDYPSGCGREPSEVPFRLIVERDGARREVSGTAPLRERNPAVLEFSVP